MALMVWPIRFERPSPKFSVIDTTSTPASPRASRALKKMRMFRAMRARRYITTISTGFEPSVACAIIRLNSGRFAD
ncbi:hypothetical protein ASE91_00730 [Sphingomonas sp. Leaf62]|nr:hypothetical protein ASE91_00730 [Sphingomonas sp. Leaf62]